MSCCCEEVQIGLGLNILGISDLTDSLSISNSGTTCTVTIDIPGGGIHECTLWLSDSATDPTESLIVPDVSGTTRWTVYTDSSGDASFTIEHSGASRTWYLWGKYEPLDVSAAVTIGS
jgi:hypothetical protein